LSTGWLLDRATNADHHGHENIMKVYESCMHYYYQLLGAIPMLRRSNDNNSNVIYTCRHAVSEVMLMLRLGQLSPFFMLSIIFLTFGANP
jgi:hypothetical protein